MRKAFASTFADPEFLAEAQKRGLGVSSPRSGEELQQLIERVYKTMPPAMVTADGRSCKAGNLGGRVTGTAIARG